MSGPRVSVFASTAILRCPFFPVTRLARVRKGHGRRLDRGVLGGGQRAVRRVVEYLEYSEIQAALLTIDRTTRDRRRDYALLATMFNTGARVQEILDVRPSDVTGMVRRSALRSGRSARRSACPWL